MSDTNVLNFIYRNRLYNLGLNKKFLTTSEMSNFLKKLCRKNIITERVYKNMYSYFIEQDHSISNTTLSNYKKVLNEYNYSNILLTNSVDRNINFCKFNLFKTTKRIKNDHILFIILSLLAISYVRTNYNSIIFNAYKNKFYKLIKIIDNS